MANDHSADVDKRVESEHPESITRRQFLGKAVLAASTIAVLGFSLTGCDEEDERRRRRREEEEEEERQRERRRRHGYYGGEDDGGDRDRDDRDRGGYGY